MDFRFILLAAPILLFSMVAHEYAHGYAALKQGDPTAYQLGRLTWNPAKHIDPFMTIILPLISLMVGGVILGGAKPIPVDPRNYRHYRRGDIIVSLAGVLTNLVIAGVCAALIVPLGMLGQNAPAAATSLSIMQTMALVGVQMNLMLALFNLMPIPPLDGSHVVKHLLPAPIALQYERIGRYGLIILMVVLMVGRPIVAKWMAPAVVLMQETESRTSSYLLPRTWL